MARLGTARGAFIRLKSILKSTSTSRKTKIKLYNSCVLPVLLYGAECWRMIEKDINKLSSFHNGYLRGILKIFWPVQISNENLHEITNSTKMRAILKKYRWRWIGHILRNQHTTSPGYLWDGLQRPRGEGLYSQKWKRWARHGTSWIRRPKIESSGGS